MVEMWKNYQPNVPPEYHLDEMYAEPSPNILLKMKMETVDRSEFRAILKAKKYVEKERVESMAFNGKEGKARLEWVFF